MGSLSIYSVILLLAVKYITTSSIMTTGAERDSESSLSSDDVPAGHRSWCGYFSNILYSIFDDSSERIPMSMIYIQHFRNDSSCEESFDIADDVAQQYDRDRVDEQVAEATEVSFFNQVVELDEDETDTISITNHANLFDIPVAIPINEEYLSNTIIAYINGRPVYMWPTVEEALSNLLTSRSTDISTRLDFDPLRLRNILDW